MTPQDNFLKTIDSIGPDDLGGMMLLMMSDLDPSQSSDEMKTLYANALFKFARLGLAAYMLHKEGDHYGESDTPPSNTQEKGQPEEGEPPCKVYPEP